MADVSTHGAVNKVLLGACAVVLFVSALKLMQSGAYAIAPVIERYIEVETVTGAFGFGWGAAYVLLSGSPVAATAIAFFNAEVIDRASTFAMITGSRFGAAFVVLLLGFFYRLYHRQSIRHVRIGLLALIITASIYLPAFALGLGVLEFGWFDDLENYRSRFAEALERGPVEAIMDLAEKHLPAGGIFLAGLVLIVASFKLFDLSLPNMEDEDRQDGFRRYVYSRWAMFGLGAVVTLLTMSVTVSLGLLVPLHNRGIVRVRHAVPYIMGANIATFIDTLLAAMTVERAGAMVIVLVEIIAVALISLSILFFAYQPFERWMLGAVERVTATRRNLALFVVILLALPAVLLIASRA